MVIIISMAEHESFVSVTTDRRMAMEIMELNEIKKWQRNGCN